MFLKLLLGPLTFGRLYRGYITGKLRVVWLGDLDSGIRWWRDRYLGVLESQTTGPQATNLHHLLRLAFWLTLDNIGNIVGGNQILWWSFD